MPLPLLAVPAVVVISNSIPIIISAVTGGIATITATASAIFWYRSKQEAKAYQRLLKKQTQITQQRLLENEEATLKLIQEITDVHQVLIATVKSSKDSAAYLASRIECLSQSAQSLKEATQNAIHACQNLQDFKTPLQNHQNKLNSMRRGLDNLCLQLQEKQTQLESATTTIAKLSSNLNEHVKLAEQLIQSNQDLNELNQSQQKRIADLEPRMQAMHNTLLFFNQRQTPSVLPNTLTLNLS